MKKIVFIVSAVVLERYTVQRVGDLYMCLRFYVHVVTMVQETGSCVVFNDADMETATSFLFVQAAASQGRGKVD